MLKKLSIISFFLFTISIYGTASYITYSHEEMLEYKRQAKEKMTSSPFNQQDQTYQMQRALITLACNDTDMIPKVIGAGEIFNDGIAPYQLMHNGIKIILNSYYDVQWLTDVIYGLKGHHEPQEEKCFYEVLKYIPDDSTMIELGSYWAYYSLWFASAIKGAHNYMIEPDQQRLEIGKRNFELNNKTGFFKRGFVGKIVDPSPDVTGTNLISIDDFIENENIKHVHILHADIQGAEYEMLQTTVKHLDIIDYFFISTHGTDIHHQCLQFLTAHNCIILTEHDYLESYGSDGLIVAKRNGVAGPDHLVTQRYR